ncbi:MAG: hypothetical protein ACKOVA_03145, partial [Novosphingobium sp.]
APTVVAIAYFMIMSALTIAYCREAARLSSASAREVLWALLISAVPGGFVAVALVLLEMSHFGRALEQRLFVPVAVALSAVALGAGLLVIRKRLMTSIHSLGYVRLAGEEA